MSVFETVAVRDGRPLLLKAHLDLLRQAASDLLGREAAARCELFPSALEDWRLDGKTGVLRFYVTAGPGGLTDPVANPAVFALFEACAVGAGPGDGLRVASAGAPFNPVPGGWKTGNYWPNVRALCEARDAGCDDAVLFNATGGAVSFSVGNLFVEIAGKLLTPPPESGARKGAVRGWVMNHTSCEECPLGIEDLRRATGMFRTNSRTGVAAVSEFDGRPLTPGSAASLARHYACDVLGG